MKRRGGAGPGSSTGTPAPLRALLPALGGARMDLPANTDVESTLKLISGKL